MNKICVDATCVHRRLPPHLQSDNVMPETGSSGTRRITIDGRFLDDVRTRIHSRDSRSLSYLSAPVERHQATEDSVPSTTRGERCIAFEIHAVIPLAGGLHPFIQGATPVDYMHRHDL
jgi:hypothetical protein